MISDYSLTDIISLLKIEPQTVPGVYVHFSEPATEEVPLRHPFRINSFLLFIIISGEITTQVNILDQYLKKGDVLLLPPNTVVHYKYATQDFQQITINFTLDFSLATSIKNQLSIANFLISNEVKFLKANESQTNILTQISNLLLIKNAIPKELNKLNLQTEQVLTLFLNLLLELFEIEKSDINLLKVKSRKELIFIELLKVIKQHYKTHRNAAFYADKLSVSKSYLNKITKELNNKTINDLIDYAVITESKFLLSNPNFTINDIAENLNFSDQSSFGKYFKKHTNITPLKFRNTL